MLSVALDGRSDASRNIGLQASIFFTLFTNNTAIPLYADMPAINALARCASVCLRVCLTIEKIRGPADGLGHAAGGQLSAHHQPHVSPVCVSVVTVCCCSVRIIVPNDMNSAEFAAAQNLVSNASANNVWPCVLSLLLTWVVFAAVLAGGERQQRQQLAMHTSNNRQQHAARVAAFQRSG